MLLVYLSGYNLNVESASSGENIFFNIIIFHVRITIILYYVMYNNAARVPRV